MSFTYTIGLPTPPHIPGTDVAGMQQNCNTISNAITVDHYPFNDGRCGKHQWVRFPNLNPAPNTGATEWSIYADTTGFPASDAGNVDLFAQVPNNGLRNTLMRSLPGGNPSLSIAASGYTQLFGGLIIQWGTATKKTGQSVSFNIPFPQACFGVLTTILEPGTSRHFLYVTATAQATFTVTSRDASGADETNTFFWVAIGI